MWRASLLLVLATALPATATFNWTTCPGLDEVQLPSVAADYTLDKYEGKYYELAFHDILQAACPKVTCVNSNKTVHTYPDGQVYVREDWGLRCLGHSYPQVLLNNVTSSPGYFRSFVPVAKLPGVPKGLLKNLIFPNIVVDFRPGTDGWTLEFQCFQLWGKIRYIGVNFYARNTSEATYADMLKAAKRSGIDFFFNGGDTGFNFRRVNQSNCPDESH